MSEKETDNITITTKTQFKGQIRVEGAARGHSISEAGEEILKLGFNLYLKKFKPKYTLTSEKKAAAAQEAA